MSFADQAAVASSPEFQARLGACIQKESRTKDDALAGVILTGNTFPVQQFLPFVTTEPGFDVPDQSTITDGEILAAVQLVWPLVLETNYPPAAA